jgi:hypothetical protein
MARKRVIAVEKFGAVEFSTALLNECVRRGKARKHTLPSIEKQAKSIGYGITEICRRSGVNRMYVSRIRGGYDPKPAHIDAMVAALRECAQERAAAAAKVLGS